MWFKKCTTWPPLSAVLTLASGGAERYSQNMLGANRLAASLVHITHENIFKNKAVPWYHIFLTLRVMKSVIFGSDLSVMPMMMRDRGRLYTLLWYKQNTLSLSVYIYIYVNLIKHVDITGAHHVEAASTEYIFCQGVPVYLYIYICARAYEHRFWNMQACM